MTTTPTYSRSHARAAAVAIAGTRRSHRFARPIGSDGAAMKISEYFGCNTFGFDMMEKTLSAKDVAFLKEFATSNTPLTAQIADKVATAVKEWAIARGATHYCHWFQPQTGATAEKHDAFFSLTRTGNPVERFTGKELIQSEPDASSFPSGGRRSTFEARGYTAWDASSPMFLMETDCGITLCIPSLFVSYSGEALDKKTPLLRSIAYLSTKAVEALHLLGQHDSNHVVNTAGPEQEYFVADETLANLRPDLLITGRTLIGRSPPRGQQLEDHYFGSIRPRVLAYMMECEQELFKLGVPCKTRHNEVAPSQCEMAPIFESANVAADHNQLVMEVLRSVAKRHGLVALFHEKPYAGINGSGKHVNWSMADSHGHNLLEPGDNPLDNLRFLYFLTATVKAVHDSGNLLRCAVASPGNDFRLGANEAPPGIMSVFLGETLNEILNRIEEGRGDLTQRAREINLELAKVPVIARDNTDRNRTSPFAFTGNKFEFRAVGASASISPALTYLNAAVGKSIDSMNAMLRAKSPTPRQEDILAVIQEVARATKAVRFEGNNYSTEWHQEAKARGLSNYRTTPEALAVLKLPEIQELLAKAGIHTKDECSARYAVQIERYNKVRLIEVESMLELISTHVLPAALAQTTMLATTITQVKALGAAAPSHLAKALEEMTNLANQAAGIRTKLRGFIETTLQNHNEEAVADSLATEGLGLLDQARKVADDIELNVDDELWALPKYRELLFLM